MGTEIVHDHHVAGLQLRAQDLIQIGEEYFPVRGRFDGHRSNDSAGAHRAQYGEDLPVTFRCALMHSGPARGASIETRHARRDTAFVKEDQFLRRDGAEPLDELFPPPAVLFCVPLGGVERLFFSLRPIRFSARATCARLMLSPHSWPSFCCN